MTRSKYVFWMAVATAAGLATVMAFMPIAAEAELRYKSIAVTDVSQTYIIPTPSAGVQLCNWGSNEAFFRVFMADETPAAATASYSQIPAGTATAPYCVGLEKPPTASHYIKAISLIATTAETATVTVQSW